MEPIFDYFRSLQDPDDEDEDYLWTFCKTKEKEVEERMGEMVPAEMRRELDIKKDREYGEGNAEEDALVYKVLGVSICEGIY